MVKTNSRLAKNFQSLFYHSMASKLVRLPPEIEEQATSLILRGAKLEEIAIAIGLNSKQAFVRYCYKFPEFKEIYERAKEATAIDIEEQYLHCLDDLSVDAAKVQMEILRQYLKWLNPKKYGDKQQIDLSVTIDISGSLERAERRIADVSMTNVIAISPAKKTEEI